MWYDRIMTGERAREKAAEARDGDGTGGFVMTEHSQLQRAALKLRDLDEVAGNVWQKSVQVHAPGREIFVLDRWRSIAKPVREGTSEAS